MSSDEAEALMEELERKWDSKHKREFLYKMERKLNRRTQYDLG